MHFLWENIFLLVICVLPMYGEPDMDFFKKAKCPNSTIPLKCPPFAMCHNFEQYCHMGDIWSCFPRNISTNDTALLQWCAQSNDSSLLDATCRFACHSKFGDVYFHLILNQNSRQNCFPHDLADDLGGLLVWCRNQTSNNFAALPHPSCNYACIDKFNARDLYHNSPDTNGISTDFPWGIPLSVILGTLLAVSVFVNVLLSVCVWKLSRGQNSAQVTNESQGNTSSTPTSNNNSIIVGVKEQEPSATPEKDSRETDKIAHQAPINQVISCGDANKSSISNTHVKQSGHEQGGSTDTQTGDQRSPPKYDQSRSTNGNTSSTSTSNNNVRSVGDKEQEPSETDSRESYIVGTVPEISEVEACQSSVSNTQALMGNDHDANNAQNKAVKNQHDGTPEEQSPLIVNK